MRYTRTAITQLSKWYRNILIKCAIFNAAVFIGAVGISGNAKAIPHIGIEGNKEVSGNYSGYDGSELKYEGSDEYVPGEGGVFVVNDGAHLTVTGGTYANNTTKSPYGNDGAYGGKGGGAIATESSHNGKVTGHLTIQGAIDNYVYFTGNTAASVGGGAIYAGSVNLIDYAWFNANNGTVNPYSISYPSSIGGGAIYLDLENGATNTVISNSVFQNNVTSLLAGRANKGGAIYVSGSSVNNYHIDFINDSFSNNITGQGSQAVDTDIDNYNYGEGGAIHFTAMADDSATIAGSEFIENKAAEGGAIYGYTAPTLTIQAGTNLDGTQKRTTFSENLATKRGGAIFHSGNDLHISDTDFTGNSVIGKNDSTSSVDGGGAIYYVGSSASRPHYATIENSIFDKNIVENWVTDENRIKTATALGGALHFKDSSYGITSITDTTFTNNSASVVNRPYEDSSSTYMSRGGAAYLLVKSFNGDNLTFTGNSADIAGGMFLNGNAYSVIDHSTFQSNTAKYRGGAAYLAVPGYDYLVIRNSTIGGDKDELGNTAQYGGGLYLNTGANIENSTIMNNKASETGGGIYSGTAVKIKDSTIAYNNSPIGSAIYNYNSGYDTSKISLDNVKIYNNTGGSAIAGRTMYFVNSDIYYNNAGSGSNVIDAINGILIDTNVVNNTGKYSINTANSYEDMYIQAINRDVLIDNPNTQGLNILVPIHLFAADNHKITIKDDSHNGIMYQYDGVVNYDGSIINSPGYIGDGLELYNGVANINAKMDASIYQTGGVLNLNNDLADNRGLTIEGDAVANLSSKNEGLSFLRLRSSDGALVNIDGDKNIGTLASVYPTYNAIDTTLDNAITSVNIDTYTNYMGLSEKDELHLNLDADFSTAAIDKYTIDLLKIDTTEKNKYADIVFSVDRVNNLSSTDLKDRESKKFKFLQINEMQNDSGRPISDEYVRVGLGRINDTEMTEYYTDKSYNYLVDDSDLGTIKITKGSGLSLDSAIKNEVNSKMYTFKEDYKDSVSLGSLNGQYLGINGEGYGMDGRDSSNNYAEGITVDNGQLLVLNDVGSLDLAGNANKKIVGFKNAGTNKDGGFIANEQGSVEINNSVIADNDSINSVVSATSEAVSADDPESSETNTKIKNSAFLNNKKISSGLVVNNGDLAALTVKDTTFKNNDGYAIINSGSATVNDTLFDSNSSAINNSGTMSVLDADFINNTGADKIATIVNSGTMKLTQVNIEGNQGQYGAIYNAADSNGSTELTISSPYGNRLVISGNKDKDGNSTAIHNSAYIGSDGTINRAEVVFTNYDYDAANYSSDFKGLPAFVIDDKITGHDGDDYIANQILAFADTGLYEVNNIIENNTLSISGSATLTLGNGGEIADSVIFDSVNGATLNINEGAKATFSGADNIRYTNINLQGGELVIGVDNSGNQLTKSSTLNVNGGILDIANGATGRINVTDSGLGTTTELKLDVDLANGKTDYLSATFSGLSPVVISTINFISDAATETSVTITNTNMSAYAFSVADDVVFTNTNSDYQVTYDPSRGKLTFVPLDLYDNIYAAVTNTEKDVRSYSLKDGGSGAEVVTQALGTLVGTSLSVNGKNLALDGNSTEGLQITDGQTLTLNNVKEVRNFSDAAVKNANGGTVEVASTAFANNGTTDIINEGTLNLTSGNVSFEKGVTGTGITNITGAKVTLEDGASIAQALNIESGSLTTSANNLVGTVKNNAANGLVLNGGTLNQGITGTGSTKIAGDVINSSTIAQAVNITSGSLTTSADSLGGAITNSVNGGLVLNGGTLAQRVSGNGSTVIDGDVTANSVISQAITVNTGKNLTASANNIGGAVTNDGTVNLNSGTLAQTITGGTINIASNQAVTSDLSKLAGTFENQGTLNLQGELSKDIQGSGTTVLQNDITLADNRTIAGTLNANNKNINMQDSSTSYTTLSVNNLAGTANLQIDSSLADGQTDKIVTSADSISGAILNLTSVNVTSDGGNTGENRNILTYLSGNTNNIQFQLNEAADGKLTTYTGNYEYVFSLGNAGQLDVTRTASTAGLSNFINGTNGVTGNTFSLTEDVSVTQDGAIGTVDRTNDSTTLNLNINEHTLTGKGTNSFDGITVADGYTLNVNGKDVASQGTITNFDTAFTNDGTLNISNINFENNNEDIVNAGTLNLSGANSVENIVGDGNTQVVSGTTTNNGTIEQNTVSIAEGATLNTNASNLIANTGIINAGTLELTDGANANTISGSGTTEITGTVENTGTISQAVNVANGSLTTSASGLGGTVTNDIDSGLVLNGGTLAQTVTGTGSTVIDGDVIANSAISQAITVNADKSLTASANNIDGDVTNAGILNLNGGTLAQAVGGTGLTVVAGDVTANLLISQAITVNADKSLTTSADNIGGAVDNDGTLNLNGGTLAQTVTGAGSTVIAGNVENSSTIAQTVNIESGSLTTSADGLGGTVSNTVKDGLVLNGGTLAQNVIGSGTTVIDGDVTANSVISQAITVNTSKNLTASANNIGGAISNQGTLTLNDGTLAQTVSGNGTTQITGTVKNNASIGQNLTIANNGNLTSNLANISGTVTNEGTFNLGDNLSKDILGNGTTILQNDITLADNRTIAGILDINNQTVDMGNEPAAYNTLTVGSLTGNGNLQIDVDMTNNAGKATSNDKIYVTGGASNSGILNLNVINVQNELATSDSIYSNYVDYVTGNNSNITYQLSGSKDGQIVVVTTEQKYTFTKGNDGSLDVLAQDYTGGLSDYITGEIIANNFSINKDVTLNDNEDIGLTQGSETTKNIFINNGSTLTGYDGTDKYNNGITVADGYTVNLTGSKNASIENFRVALENNKDGTLNVKDMAFKNNDKDIVNNGILNLEGANTLTNGIEGNGSTNILLGTTTNNGTITQNTVSIANTATLNTNASSLIASAGVTNQGTLELTGGTVQSNITGNGTLSILDNVTNDKTITQAIDIANDKTLTNNGILNTTIALGTNQTIDGNGTLNLTGTSINEGSITQGVVNVADTAELTTAADTITANINNAGNLKLTGGVNANTIGGAGTTQISGSVENTGTISQAIKIDSGSLTTSASGLGGAVANMVDGGLILNGGTLTQAISGDGSTQIAGNVVSNALISQAIDIDRGSLTISANDLGGAVTNTIDGGLILNGGTLTQAVSGNGSTIIAGDVLWGTNAELGNTTIAQNGSLDIGTNEVTLGNTAINGTLKMTITDMAKDSSDYTGGKLIVNDLDLGESSKLSMTVASGLITERDASTGGLDLITVNGASSGKFAEMLSNNRYAVSLDDNGKFKITYTASPTDIVNEGGGNINNAQAAEAWDKVPTTGNAATDDMQAHLNELSQHDSTGYVKALNNLAPTDSRAVARTTVDVNNLIGHQIERRQDMQGMNSGDTFQNVGAWMEGLYNYSKQDSSSTHAGFTGKTAGFALGMDGKVNEDTMVGFGYANNQTDIDTLDRDIDVDGHTLFVYGKYQPEKWYVRGMAHYGFANYDEKSDVNGKHNSADYDVQNIGLSAYAGYDLPNGITPEAGLRFTHISQDDYTDYVGQHISVDDNDILTLVAGAKYSKTFTGEDGIHWTPKARAAVTYDVIKDDNNANVDIAGINYDVTGEKINRLEFEVGLGIEADVNNWNFSVGYDAGIREDYISHTGMLRARYNF